MLNALLTTDSNETRWLRRHGKQFLTGGIVTSIVIFVLAVIWAQKSDKD